MAMTDIIIVLLLIAGSLWCIAGDVDMAMEVFPAEAVSIFRLDEDGCFRLHPEDVPGGLRVNRWEQAILDLLNSGLAMMDPDGNYILTSRGEELRKMSQS